MKSIEIVVSRTGQTTVQTKGFSGAACLEASRFVEQALGVRQDEERTSEFYQSEPQPQSVQQGTTP
ncbi:MAG: DUF2997 domain-containing protein [Planctomycetia bacterium]|nr:DUF2997 domain-containing protein [Planctomycetia bacterium]